MAYFCGEREQVEYKKLWDKIKALRIQLREETEIENVFSPNKLTANLTE